MTIASSVRAIRSLAALVVLATLAFAGVVSTSGPFQAAPSTGHRAWTLAADDHPGPGDDFPQLPASCQSAYQQIPFRPCRVTDFGPRRPMVVVWGDSHAWMYQQAYVRAARARQVNLVMIIAGGCPPALSRPRVPGHSYSQCETRQPQALAWIEKQAKSHPSFKLIVGGYWSYYRRGWIETHDPQHPHLERYTPYARRLIDLAHYGTRPMFQQLADRHVRVDVIGPSGTVPNNAPACPAGTDPYQCNVPRRRSLYAEAETRAWILHQMAPLTGHPRLIDTSPAYCDARRCYAHVDGVNTWYDGLHLGKTFTHTLASYFLPSFDDLRRRSAADVPATVTA